MRGVVWAAVGGVAFGLFQATYRRGGTSVDAYVGTFVVMAAATVTLGLVTIATEGIGRFMAASPAGIGWFALAGGVHFLLGWTFLGLAQRRAGASRTGVLAGTTPLFGTALAFLALGETVRPLALAGVALVVSGIMVLTSPVRRGDMPRGGGAVLSGVAFGLLTAACWGTSPLFIRLGLQRVPSPLVGVTFGIAAAATAYALALAVRGAPRSGRPGPAALRWLLGAGLLVSIGIAGQWIALDLAPVAVVLALNQLAVPVVVLVSPVLLADQGEGLTPRTAAGGVFVLAGTLLIITARAAT